MATPLLTSTEIRTRSTFLALMWALSYPGRPHTLPIDSPSEAFPAIAETLLDLETSYYTPDQALAEFCQTTTSRAEPISNAEYLFFPAVQTSDLPMLEQARVGTMMFPDQAATLILGAAMGQGVTLHLTGPGVQGETTIQIGNLPPHFWTLREQMRRYPLGWDIFLVCGAQVIGLPRSTTISIEE